MTGVLILGDQPGALEVLDFFLSSHGFRVRSARTIREAVFLTSEAAPEVVLCDLDVFDVDPREVLASLRSLPALDGAPIVAIGAAARARGFDALLDKPCPPPRVADALRRALRHSRRAAREVGQSDAHSG